MKPSRLVALVPLLLVAACGSADEADPGGISADEAQELNDAAAMLDDNAISLGAVTNTNSGDAR